VVRGGSWNNNAKNTRSANRNRNEPDNRNNNVGFRLAPARMSVDTSFDQTVILSILSYGEKKLPFGALVAQCGALSESSPKWRKIEY